MKVVVCLLLAVLAAVLNPEPVYAWKKKPAVARPASRPPVYKKFDNRKKKQPQVKWGDPRKK